MIERRGLRPGAGVCVFCSSSDGLAPCFVDDARQLGRLLGERGMCLVYGGTTVGLMGEVASAAREHGARVFGAIPRSIHDRGIGNGRADELLVTEDLRSRKAAMESRADAFVALAGGFGTLEELLEIITLKQLGLHTKPVVLLNTGDFYDALLVMFERIYDGNFAMPQSRALYHVARTPAAVLEYLDAYEAMPVTSKWTAPPTSAVNEAMIDDRAAD